MMPTAPITDLRRARRAIHWPASSGPLLVRLELEQLLCRIGQPDKLSVGPAFVGEGRGPMGQCAASGDFSAVRRNFPLPDGLHFRRLSSRRTEGFQLNARRDTRVFASAARACWGALQEACVGPDLIDPIGFVMSRKILLHHGEAGETRRRSQTNQIVHQPSDRRYRARTIRD